MKAKEVAKFFSGVAADQVITHGAMAISGVQFAMLGMDFTPQFNTAAAVVWTVLMVALAYCSWIRK